MIRLILLFKLSKSSWAKITLIQIVLSCVFLSTCVIIDLWSKGRQVLIFNRVMFDLVFFIFTIHHEVKDSAFLTLFTLFLRTKCTCFYYIPLTFSYFHEYLLSLLTYNLVKLPEYIRNEEILFFFIIFFFRQGRITFVYAIMTLFNISSQFF